ncbi:MAG: hypothetical protein FJX76_21180 [Armatimonadetes bacterium]|nr:hypothetical protein [Armatimonadota bacterium]
MRLLILAAVWLLAPNALAQEQTEAVPTTVVRRRADTQTQVRDENVHLNTWAGSDPIPGTDARIKLGGFFEVDGITDSGRIGSEGQFVTATIATANTPGPIGRRAGVSVSPTRVHVEARSPIDDRQLRVVLSGDFFRDGLGLQPEPRVRQAFVEVTRLLFGANLRIGQSWSTLADLEAFPNVIRAN